MSSATAVSGLAATTAVAGQRHLTDLGTMIARSLRLASRNIESLVMGLALPVLLMLMFVWLFGGAIQTGQSYVNYVVPGVLLVCAGFGVGSTAVSVANDLNSGIVDRFRSMDVRGEALIAGHVVSSVLRNLVSMVVVVAVAVAIGFRPTASPAEWLAAAGLFALVVFALSWVCAALGVLARSPEAAAGFTFLISFLPYASSAFVPVETMPTWLQGFASNQPITPVVEALRGLLTGGPVATYAWPAIAWCVGITLVGIAMAGLFFRRRVA